MKFITPPVSIMSLPSEPGLVPGQQEKRKLPRYRVDRQAAYKLFIRTETGQRHAVSGINDISASGINILLSHQLAPGAKITVEYRDPSVSLQVYGMVMWCTPSATSLPASQAEALYLAGLELHSSSLLTTFLPEV